MSLLPLKDKVAIVTGGSRGIGRELASAVLEAGAHVLLVSRTQTELERTAQELRRASPYVDTLVADVSNPEDVERLAARIDRGVNRADVLINCAGVQGPIGFFADNDPAAWLDAIKVNLFGVFLCSRGVTPFMQRQGGGKILNLSGGGAASPRPNFSAYAASKAAVVRLTETLAEELKPYNIQVNAIAPGALPTRMASDIIEAGAARAGASAVAEAERAALRGTAAFAKAKRLAVFLASEESDRITGKFISAEWDEWEIFPTKIEYLLSSDIYTLRRVT